MTKHDFLLLLEKRLSGLPQDEVQERLDFYRESIDDRMEEGLSEEEALRQIGSVDEIAAQIIDDIPIAKLIKERTNPQKPWTAWQIVLLILGSPLWLSLLIAAFAVVLSLYMTLWALVISLWAVFASFAASSAAGILLGIGFICGGDVLQGVATIGAGCVLAGLSIFLFYGCKVATKGTVLLTKKIGLGIKKLFIRRKEDA